MDKIIECIPNFSEGRDKEVIENIMQTLRCRDNVKMLDYSSDYDHNRTVVTIIGTPEGLERAISDFAEKIYENIDMRKHKGEHPRMGALDVVPFVPVKGVEIEECIELAKRVGRNLSEKFHIPVYLYEDAATSKSRQNLAAIRKGQYEGFFEKIKQKEWKPDFGPEEVNLKGGCLAVGVRFPLVAFNVNLSTNDINIANNIARVIRNIGGGLRFVKAMGVSLVERDIVQISMNLVNYEKTAIYRAFEMIRIEAKRYGVNIIGSEVVGLVPMDALINTAEYYLQIENFSKDQILERRIWE